ncbi:TetR/AcrR family transcriptional regulator [Actinomadura alba]|uniref:TetR/AcrR family transcriptional regulator n=1 Tax=Actinomadura alba TaxID=406431 RepID=A0ABR7M2A4_9ACTN|nr:TetR/AcrR family transcriptional regulator [Actinomadura alba]MBC6471204.1 TetR/AcrR family transcriptional regulator [Actinomadura alba]
MTGTATSAEAERRAPRGRIDKRQAILDAAFTVFAREGYGQACVKDIADEAGVAKPTVYNHLSDKANLFRQAMAAAAERSMADELAAIERLRDVGDDIRTALEDVGHRLLQCYCDDRSWALRRLLHAELGRFPELLDTVRGHGTGRVNDALADRLARLSLAGRLRAGDPAEAAEQFVALLTGPIEARSRLGTVPIPDAELHTVARAGVRTFLRAYATDPQAYETTAQAADGTRG